jgi:hypothetical protein
VHVLGAGLDPQPATGLAPAPARRRERIEAVSRDGQDELGLGNERIQSAARRSAPDQQPIPHTVDPVGLAGLRVDPGAEAPTAGEFSFELYQSRYEQRGQVVRSRFVTHGEQTFSGSTERVFEQILRTLQSDFHFELIQQKDQSATLQPPGQTGSQPLQISTRIPNETPIFTCHAPLMKLPALKPEVIWSMLADLNNQVENGHFEWNLVD